MILYFSKKWTAISDIDPLPTTTYIPASANPLINVSNLSSSDFE
jgi:hypothetical protein